MGKQELITLINKMPEDVLFDEDRIIDFVINLFNVVKNSTESLEEQLRESLKYSPEECLDYSEVSIKIRKMLAN